MKAKYITIFYKCIFVYLKQSPYYNKKQRELTNYSIGQETRQLPWHWTDTQAAIRGVGMWFSMAGPEGNVSEEVTLLYINESFIFKIHIPIVSNSISTT